jgi:hypothetical protein
MRFRNVYMGLGSSLVIFIWLLSDPDTGILQSLPMGASTIATLIISLKTVLYVAILHISRKALVDYLDLKSVFEKAVATSQGAGYVAIAIGLFNVAIAIVIYAAVSG